MSINKDQLKKTIQNLYINENLSDKEIAPLVGMSSFSVWNLRKKFGIKGINFQQRRLIKNPQTPLTDRQKSIIIGSLLGDCCLKTNKRCLTNKAYISIAHSVKQKTYIMWLYDELQTICKSIPKPYIAHGKYIVYTLISENRTDLFQLREKIYIPHKTITKWYIDQINDLSIAVWYMDDGALIYRNKSTSSAAFCTNSFTEEENFMLKEMFMKKFNIKSEVVPQKPNGKIQYNIFISNESIDDFFNIVSPHMEESMKYKLPGEMHKKFLLNNIEPKISKEFLKNLYYEKKLTQQQIAQIMGVHKSTIRKYMNLFDIKTRNLIDAQLIGQNNPCQRTSSGRFATQKFTISRDEEIKANKLFNQLRTNGFPYIEKKEDSYYVNTLDKIMLKNINDYIINNKEILYCKNGMELCSAFCPQIYDMAAKKSLTPMQIFNNDFMLLDCIKRTIKYAKKDSIAAVRQGLKTYRNNRCVTLFSPMWAKIILELNFQTPRLNVLDFSCGFGGRLIGSYASNLVSKYTGIDPIAENIVSHQEIFKIIKKHSTLTNKIFNAFFHRDAAENIINSINERFDVVLTSPPYFSKEIYSHDCAQCYNKFNEYDTWKQQWLYPILKKSFELLNPGGKMIIFISNFENITLGDDCRDMFENISQQEVVCFKFQLPNLEYYRSKNIKKYDTAWVVQK